MNRTASLRAGWQRGGVVVGNGSFQQSIRELQNKEKIIKKLDPICTFQGIQIQFLIVCVYVYLSFTLGLDSHWSHLNLNYIAIQFGGFVSDSGPTGERTFGMRSILCSASGQPWVSRVVEAQNQLGSLLLLLVWRMPPLTWINPTICFCGLAPKLPNAVGENWL